jgi:hypothetical protein
MEEYSKLKSHVLKKFWDTHDYDPIKGQYYSDGKEELYREQKSILSEVYGKSKHLSIPPSSLYNLPKVVPIILLTKNYMITINCW